jgi:methylenetetrahydrofolate reductase (NADPH)
MPGEPAKSFRAAVQAKSLALTAELSLKRETSAADVRHQARTLAPWVDAVQISDNPWAWTQMSALAASSLLLDAGLDPVPILTCRDRNRIALTSDLLGLRALGVRSVMLMRGHRVPQNHPLPAATVFHLSGRELIALASELNEDETGAAGDRLFIGTGARAFRPNAGWRADSLKDRAAAGAEFLQTQLCFNLDLLRYYLSRLVDLKITWDYSVIVSLTPLPSVKTAQWIRDHLSDSKIPAAVMQRLEDAEDPRAEGIAICAELMREISTIPGISGIHLMTTGDADAIAESIATSGLREQEPAG